MDTEISIFSSSSIVKGLNLGSWNAAFFALSIKSIIRGFVGNIEPIHPRNFPSISIVTKVAPNSNKTVGMLYGTYSVSFIAYKMLCLTVWITYSL